jgi:enoyl-CoA hydratase/carnithine racemase
MRKGIELAFAQGEALEANIFGSMFDTNETKEGIKAFLEKREPNW